MLHRIKPLGLPCRLCILGLLAMLAGCSADLTDATNIATTGQTLSNQAANSLSASSDNLNSFLESQYFGSGLTSNDPTLNLPKLPANITPIPPVDPQLIASVTVIQAALAQRVEMLNQLNDLYVAYGNLAKYDASKEVQTAVSGVVTSANALDKSLHPDETSPAISQADSNLIDQAAGAIAGAAQQQELVKGSYAIRLVLEKVIPVLASEKAVYDDFNTHILISKIQVTETLWTMGLGSPDAILQAQLGSFGITYDPKQLASIDPAFKPRIAAAVDQDLKWQQTRATQLMSSTIGATIQAMQDLDTSQKQFENGQPVSIQSVQTDIQVLQTYVQLLQNALGNGKSSGASSK
jgi:hypothetical protein